MDGNAVVMRNLTLNGIPPSTREESSRGIAAIDCQRPIANEDTPEQSQSTAAAISSGLPNHN
jgi:hypothetical protein